MSIFINEAPGNTPLHPDDAAQLIPNLATRGELDEWERQNILEAFDWAFSSRVLSSRNPLDEIYLRELHRRMFDQTWKWAGVYRIRDGINLGCPFTEIHHRIATLLGDAQYWIDNNALSMDEIAVRFHHRLVWQIHAFPNGNGRHARLLASVLAASRGRPRFTWGRQNLVADRSPRDNYLAALRTLDQNDNNIKPLLDFARS
jgi:Fic-DOC domain mobile mystery protein B